MSTMETCLPKPQKNNRKSQKPGKSALSFPISRKKHPSPILDVGSHSIASNFPSNTYGLGLGIKPSTLFPTKPYHAELGLTHKFQTPFKSLSQSSIEAQTSRHNANQRKSHQVSCRNAYLLNIRELISDVRVFPGEPFTQTARRRRM